MSPMRPAPPRTPSAASISVWPASDDRNAMTSNTFDLPTPLGPAMHVKGPRWTSMSKFLKPRAVSRVSMPVESTALRSSGQYMGHRHLTGGCLGLIVSALSRGGLGWCARPPRGGHTLHLGPRAERRSQLADLGRRGERWRQLVELALDRRQLA